MTTYSSAATLRTLRQFNPWFDGFTPGPEVDVPPVSVAVSGYLRDESGWGAAGRGYVRALRSLQVPTALHDFSALTSNRSEDTSLGRGETIHDADVNLVCIDAGQHFAVMSQAGDRFFDGHYNIGAWAWELPRFPERWYDRFAYYDEIWVGTSFIASALAPIAPVPVIRIPPVLTPEAPGSREHGRREWRLEGDEFVFLFVFDVHSHLRRKNPQAIVDAFRRAFTPSERVRLILKCVNAASDPAGITALHDRVGPARVSIVDGYVPVRRLRNLMAACDAYVSLHRSEGTGLTIADAMALGKPVIATDWSGNTDFMDASNSFPVGYRLVELEDTVGPYRAGNVWAEPSVEHAAALMRHVVDHPDDAGLRAAHARESLSRDYSERSIATLVRQRLDIIGERERFDRFRRDIRALVAGYHDLVGAIRAIVERVVPPAGVVSVVSKGDPELVTFAGHVGCHFPETDAGTYSGYHPRDGAAAITLLDAAMANGRQYLLFPGTALWWLDHYPELRRHLDERCRCLWNDARCVLYDLRPAGWEQA